MAGEVRPQKQGFISKSTVIAEFVDAIPKPKVGRRGFGDTRTSWERQPGIEDAFRKAFANPGKAMVLLEYDEGPPGRRKQLAKLRALSFERQGYTEDNGWTIRAVDARVYALYNGAR